MKFRGSGRIRLPARRGDRFSRRAARRSRKPGTGPLPSLIRFLVTVSALVGLVYLGMLMLVANVKVQPREMTQIVTLPKANP